MAVRPEFFLSPTKIRGAAKKGGNHLGIALMGRSVTGEQIPLLVAVPDENICC